VPDRPPLPTLLAQVLVAFTIEFDNEAEQRMVHRTTAGRGDGPQRGPWLVSLPMSDNFVRFVDEDGVPLRDLDGLAAITNLAGLRRWGYVSVDDSTDPVVRLSRGGQHARRVWAPLAAEIEARWRDRVREAGQGSADLSVLLSRVLLAFTLDYEQETRLSLAVSANALRVLDEPGVRLRDLPALAGLSREAISMSMGLLTRSGLAVTEPDPSGGRGQVARLTPRGLRAQQGSQRRLAAIEATWATRFGAAEINALADSLHDLLTRPAAIPGTEGVAGVPLRRLA
jgi:DNA-binding MarR family transcriptional regulator